MLHIHHANRIETLRELLLARLRASDAGVFGREEVIVPSSALRRALSLALADAQGICANVHFAFLAQWLWQQIARVVPGVGETSPFATPQLTWRVHRAFGDRGFVSRHPRLGAYLDDADALMRYELACRVAALLEHYVTYRPDWLQAWRDGGAQPSGLAGSADAAWQAALWQGIDAELGGPLRQPTQAFAAALQRGGAAAARRAGLPDCAHVFALPGIAPLHLRMLQLLAGAIDVHVYVLNPCREYWFDVVDRRRLSHLAARGQAQGHDEGNRLLASWGKATQVHVEMLVEAGEADAGDDACFVPATGNSLLARVQNAMLDLQPIEPGSIHIAEDDRSVEVHRCHSLTRELEVLQDRLLGLFVESPALRPSDIVVVTPDLDAAAPLIDALFGTAPAERFIPYTVSGRARSTASAPARALLALLTLAASRCAASALFAVLQLPIVARRFGLDDAALEQVHAWLGDAGFHWALDERHLARLDLPGAARHTLDAALQRLFLGYALPGHFDEPFQGWLGAGDAEGTGAVALGALWRFASALQCLSDELSTPKPPQAWAATLAGVLDTFLQAQGDALDEQRELQQAIGRLVDDMCGGGVDECLPLAVVRAALQQQLEDPAHGGTAGGGVTFASMSALRGLPFAVVCAIGLNDGDFPTAQPPAEFDLIAQHPRRGDRQRRLDERGLMLDLLLAARSHLHLSHTGRSVRDNAPLPPSVLVAELLDLLLPAIAADASPAALQAARKRLVVEHPLQAFAPAAFAVDGDPRQRSFNGELADALRRSLRAAPAAESGRAQPDDGTDGDEDGSGIDDDESALPAGPLGGGTVAPFFSAPLAAPETTWREVSLGQLVEFFRNPCRYLLRRRLAIELPRAADELQDDECFVPDARARGALAQRLLPALLRGAGPDTAVALAHAGTEMPAGALGRQQLQAEMQALQQFADEVRQASAANPLPPHSVALDVELDGEAWSLRADFADLRPVGLLRWRYGDSRAADYLEGWLHHLLLCAAPPAAVQLRTRWLSADGEFAFDRCAAPLAPLGEVLRLYRQGLCEPLHFYPRTSWQWQLHGRARALATWRPGLQRGVGESEDPAYVLALRGVDDPLDAAFEAVASAVLGPLHQHLRDARLTP
jgi:exodeoxyribonuclease V gamma subunit